MAHLSRWLVDRGLDEHALTSSVVEEFLQARRVAGYRQWLSARGMAPLLDHLRDVGIAPVCSPAVADGVVEVLLAGYRAYLVEERGLAASTVRNYVDVARQFVSQYCASGRTDLCGLTAAQVSEFVLAGCRTRCVGSAAILVVGMRALLRYLHLAGVTQTGMAGAVPSAASWPASCLPQPIDRRQAARLLIYGNNGYRADCGGVALGCDGRPTAPRLRCAPFQHFGLGVGAARARGSHTDFGAGRNSGPQSAGDDRIGGQIA